MRISHVKKTLAIAFVLTNINLLKSAQPAEPISSTLILLLGGLADDAETIRQSNRLFT